MRWAPKGFVIVIIYLDFPYTLYGHSRRPHAVARRVKILGLKTTFGLVQIN